MFRTDVGVDIDQAQYISNILLSANISDFFFFILISVICDPGPQNQ